jgi:HEAT repeat protein
MKRTTASSFLTLLLLVAGACTAAPTRHEIMPDDLVARLEASDPAQREAIAREAWKAGPDAILALAGPLASDDLALRANALLAVETIAHHACAPGSASERARASEALAALLGAPLDASVRADVARLLGAVANDRAGVRALADALADPDVAEAALFALERCRHADAGRELLEALARSDLALPRIAVVKALGARREQAAAGELVALAARGQPEEARAARTALARIGDPRAEALLSQAWTAGEPGAGADLLRYAQARRDAGEGDDAARLVAPLLAAPREHLRAGAVRISAAADEEQSLPALMAALADPSAEVRAVAREELIASTSRRTAGELERAMDAAAVAAGPSRSEFLRVIVARRDRSAVERLQAAIVDTSPQLRLVALELAGELVEPTLEEPVRRGARSIDELERSAARRSLLAYADAHREARRKDQALELYHELIVGGDADEATRAALAGVAALGDPASLEPVRALVGRPELADDVDRARVALAVSLARTDRDGAVAELDAVCTGSASRGVRADAAERLRELGVDTSAYARRRGFLTSWYVCGPLTGQAIGTQPFGPAGPAFPGRELEQASAGAGLPPWERVESTDLDGVLDLDALLDPNTNVCAYAMWDVRVTSGPTDLLLRLGSDDGVAVWLNGELVHVNDVARGLSVDSDEVPVTLREGANVLLVQVTQGGGDWGLCVRACSPDGAPLDISR